MITHDAILIPLIATWVGESFEHKWLDPLDGILITFENKNGMLSYRNNQTMRIL